MKINSKKNDPRVTRTHNLIQDAFLSLASEKDFEAITVKDIADRAIINRATFYAHFEDKYALLDNLISETFTSLVSDKIKPEAELTEETLKELILIMCDYNDTVKSHCKQVYRSASSLFDSKIQLKLYTIVKNLLVKNFTNTKVDAKKIDTYAIMISGSIYFATNQCHKEVKSNNNSELVSEILPFILAGIETVYV